MPLNKQGPLLLLLPLLYSGSGVIFHGALQEKERLALGTVSGGAEDFLNRANKGTVLYQEAMQQLLRSISAVAVAAYVIGSVSTLLFSISYPEFCM